MTEKECMLEEEGTRGGENLRRLKDGVKEALSVQGLNMQEVVKHAWDKQIGVIWHTRCDVQPVG